MSSIIPFFSRHGEWKFVRNLPYDGSSGALWRKRYICKCGKFICVTKFPFSIYVREERDKDLKRFFSAKQIAYTNHYSRISMTFEEWLLRLKDIDTDRYEQIRAMLRQEKEAQEPLQMEDARCGHEQITQMECDLCGMDFS